MIMLDFTSALYLGFRHTSSTLGFWPSFTCGKPAALYESALAQVLKSALARLVGLEQATLGSSSLHLFWDIFGQLPSQKWAVFIDTEAYPIARWGAERAASRGLPVQSFPHHDSITLGKLLHQSHSYRPLIVTDGFCPACGKFAPISTYLKVLRHYGGLLLLDDTQALGILGSKSNSQYPYGQGGGGSLKYTNLAGPDILLISSLAKGFGVPIAVLAGSQHNLSVFEHKSDTRVHCSPPSQAALSAAKHALSLNRRIGERLRQKLSSLVNYFRKHLKELGLHFQGNMFPVQSLSPVEGIAATTLYQRLLRHGIHTVLQGGHGVTPRLSFLLSARHTYEELEYLVETLSYVIGLRSKKPYYKEIKYV